MDYTDERGWLSTVSLLIIAGVALAVALAYTRAVMVPFVLAILFTYLVAPIVDGMQTRLKFPRGLSIVVAIVFVILVLVLLVMLITVSIRGITESSGIYTERLTSLAESVFSVLDRFNVDLGQDALVEGLGQIPIGGFVRSTAGGVLSLVTTGFLVLVFTIFLLAGRRPNEVREGIYLQIDAKIRRYLITKVATSSATGILVGLLLAMIGLDLALVFGVLAFFLNFIPNVGSFVAVLLPLPLAIVQFDDWSQVALVLALPMAVQLTVGSFIEPKLMGDGLDVHPITILIGLVFWGLIWGAVGMLLAAPIMAVFRIVLARFETTRPIAELLAGRLGTPASDAAAG